MVNRRGRLPASSSGLCLYHTLTNPRPTAGYCCHVGLVPLCLYKMPSFTNVKAQEHNALHSYPTTIDLYFVLEWFERPSISGEFITHTRSLGDRNLLPCLLHAASSKLLLRSLPFGFREGEVIITLQRLPGGASVPSVPPLLASAFRSSDQKNTTL